MMQFQDGTPLIGFLRAQILDCGNQWSVGTFGGLAEFSRGLDETFTLHETEDAVALATALGGIRLTASRGTRIAAFESLTRDSWNQSIALCLPESACAMSRRTALAELGPDRDAIRPADRDAILFDLGIGALQVDACIRVADPDIASALRALTGRNVFEPGNPAMSIIVPHGPNRVFVSRLGRVEVFQPIPPPHGRSPDGPHTHILPKLLQHGRTHAATEPIPAGFVPCAYQYPAHPAKDTHNNALPFDGERHLSFQRMLAQFGDPELRDLKQHVVQAVEQDADPAALSAPDGRFARAAVRIALRQLAASGHPSPALAAWLAAHDMARPNEADFAQTDLILH
jgi:hypothetical protein